MFDYGAYFDTPEFITGLLVGVVIMAVVFRLGGSISMILQSLFDSLRSVGSGLSSKSGDPYQLDTLTRMQMLHAAKALFKLDEIAVPPRLLAPPIPADPLRTDPLPEYTLAVLPNLPDWNYLSGIYHAPSISIANAFADGANFMITGELGSGKTTALAYFALQVLKRTPEAGTAADMVPIFIHAADLGFSRRSDKDPMNILISAAQKSASSSLASRIPTYVRPLFRRGRALLLLDGLDELTVDEISPIAKWLVQLQQVFPDVRIIASGPTKGFDGLAEAGLVPIPIAPWTEHDRTLFLTKWGQAWQQHIKPILPKKSMHDIDPVLISGWLSNLARGQTPFEMVLRLWTAYAGDAKDTSIPEGANAHIARFLSPDERPYAEAAGLSWLNERCGALPERSLRRGTPVNDFISAGILIRRADNRVSFAIPALGAYLGARAMLTAGLSQNTIVPGWLPVESALCCYAALGGDLTDAVGLYIETQDDPLNSRLLTAARWLRDSPKKAPWRAKVMRPLAALTTSNNQPYGLRLRAIHALTRSEDPSTAILFRRLLASEEHVSRLLGALGLGGVRDEESIKRLLDTVYQDHQLHVRQAACLALAAIGTNSALEGLGKVLLEGDEAVRLAVAEALAAQPGEGINMLRDAIDVDNLLTRRAAVFGIARVPEAWALEMLEAIHLEDDQWIVRGAAAEALERVTNPPWRVHPPQAELSETPWLIEFAKRENLGIAPGRASYELLRQALNKGKDEEKIAALEAIGASAAEEMALELRQALQSNDTYIRDAAFEALWRINAAGLHSISIAQQPS